MQASSRVFVMAAVALGLVEGQGQLNSPNRAQTINNIFQIPIQTLSAVSDLAQSTKPLGDFVQQFQMRKMMKHQKHHQNQYQNQNQYENQNKYENQYQRPVNDDYNGGGSQQYYISQQITYGRGGYGYRPRPNQIAGVQAAADGSAFRI